MYVVPFAKYSGRSAPPAITATPHEDAGCAHDAAANKARLTARKVVRIVISWQSDARAARKQTSAGVHLQVRADVIRNVAGGVEVGMAHEDEAVRQQRLHPVAAMRADREQLHGRDVLAVARENAIEPFNALNVALALGALEDDRAVVEPLDVGMKGAVDDRLRPAGEEIDVAGKVHRVDRVRARRPRGDLAEHRLAVALQIPIHVREAGLVIKRLQ